MILLSGLTGAIPVQGPAFPTALEWLCVRTDGAVLPAKSLLLELNKALTGQYQKTLKAGSQAAMLCQGAIRRAGHGGDLFCPNFNAENSLRHVLHDCPRWAVFDLGPDPARVSLFSDPPECFQVWTCSQTGHCSSGPNTCTDGNAM